MADGIGYGRGRQSSASQRRQGQGFLMQELMLFGPEPDSFTLNTAAACRDKSWLMSLFPC